ncbi:MAG: Gfo/Idh/MocA family protein [Puniceicoccaceae bacterium]
MLTNRHNRRRFIRNGLASSVAIAGAPTIIPSAAWGQAGSTRNNSKIQVGMIGVGGMGTSHLKTLLGQKDVRVVGICDVRKEHRDRALGLVKGAYGDKAQCLLFNDFREILSLPELDAVCIAVPDHWHVLIGLEACRRGKAMYYEKPMGYTVEETQAIRAAVQRHNSIFQFGTQNRSDGRFRKTVELVRNGYLGELQRVIVGTASYDPAPVEKEEPVPEGLDYDMWLGPAPVAPYTPLRCTRNWTLIRDYSLGCLSGAYGIHNVDIAQWGITGDESCPVEIEGTGTIPGSGIYDTFRKFEVHQKYANGVTMIHIDHISAMDKFPLFDVKNSMGVLFEGSEGWVYVARGYMDAHPKSLMRVTIGPNEFKLPPSNNHWRNFLGAVRHGTNPICGVEAGSRSEIACQQAEIALRLGRKLRWDNQREQFIDDPVANRYLARAMRGPWHL